MPLFSSLMLPRFACALFCLRQQACIRHEKRTCCSASPNEKQQRPNLPCGRPQSTLGADELNFCVRDGNRWSLIAIVTAMVYIRDFSRIYLSIQFAFSFRQPDNCIESLS